MILYFNNKRESGIYCIENKVNGHKYVGQALNVNERISGHFRALRKHIHPNSHLQRAFIKYGENNFVFYTLEKCSIKGLTKREQYWMDKLRPQYNQMLIAGDSCQHSDETKKKISLANKGRSHSAETRIKMSLARRGKHYPNISLALTGKRNQKLSKKLKGRIFTDKWKRNLSLALKGRTFTDEWKKKISDSKKENKNAKT